MKKILLLMIIMLVLITPILAIDIVDVGIRDTESFSNDVEEYEFTFVSTHYGKCNENQGYITILINGEDEYELRENVDINAKDGINKTLGSTGIVVTDIFLYDAPQLFGGAKIIVNNEEIDIDYNEPITYLDDEDNSHTLVLSNFAVFGCDDGNYEFSNIVIEINGEEYDVEVGDVIDDFENKIKVRSASFQSNNPSDYPVIYLEVIANEATPIPEGEITDCEECDKIRSLYLLKEGKKSSINEEYDISYNQPIMKDQYYLDGGLFTIYKNGNKIDQYKIKSHGYPNMGDSNGPIQIGDLPLAARFDWLREDDTAGVLISQLVEPNFPLALDPDEGFMCDGKFFGFQQTFTDETYEDIEWVDFIITDIDERKFEFKLLQDSNSISLRGQEDRYERLRTCNGGKLEIQLIADNYRYVRINLIQDNEPIKEETSEIAPIGIEETDIVPEIEVIALEESVDEVVKCAGCLDGDKCIPQQLRIQSEAPQYCDYDNVLKNQKENEGLCQNNFECKSNQCSNGACVDIVKEVKENRTFIESILNWFSNIFS